jgi:hypothetical protein
MQEEDLVQDVSTEELIKLKAKAAKHASSMKAAKNVKDVVKKAEKAETKASPKTKSKAKLNSKKTDNDDKWLDDFSHMASEEVRSEHETRIKTKESFSSKPLTESSDEDEISAEDVSRHHHAQDEVISEDILEELGVSTAKAQEDDESKLKKPTIIPGVKVYKKPINSPIVDSPPKKPLGPRDSLADLSLGATSQEVVNTPQNDFEEVKKSRFGLKLRRKKPVAETKSDPEHKPKQKEVAHVLYQDPAKEAEERVENNQDLLSDDETIDLYSEPTPQRDSEDNSPKAVIEREEFKENLKHQAEEQTSDMIFTPEARVIRNIEKKPSGYSMVATISEGGYAFRSKKTEQNAKHNEHKFSDIEKANKEKIMGKKSSSLGFFDILSIIIILAVVVWFFYMILLA